MALLRRAASSGFVAGSCLFLLWHALLSPVAQASGYNVKLVTTARLIQVAICLGSLAWWAILQRRKAPLWPLAFPALILTLASWRGIRIPDTAAPAGIVALEVIADLAVLLLVVAAGLSVWSSVSARSATKRSPA